MQDMETVFDFSYFSSDHAGRAVCILNLNEETKTLKYVLRFDQSQGEPLVHIDFAYHDTKEFKHISHRPLDFEAVYLFNPKLFIAMMLRTASVLIDELGFVSTQQDGSRFRYEIPIEYAREEENIGGANIVDVLCLPYTQQAIIGIGSVHHVAYRTPSDKQQEVLRQSIVRTRRYSF